MRLADKTAVITGGGSGQGEATAHLFAQEGANVVIVDINKENGETTAADIKFNGHEKVSTLQANISNEEAVKNVMSEASEAFGSIDILVNCAGMRGPSGKSTMDELSMADWTNTLNVNLIGPWLCIKHAVPFMRAQNKGAIINVSSTAGIRGIPGASPYCVSKAALLMLTKTAALEYIEFGIRVNCILPGHIDTPMMNSVIEDMKGMGIKDAYNKVNTQSNPIGRLGTPLEIATTILFLATEDSSFITGADIYVDGGYAAG